MGRKKLVGLGCFGGELKMMVGIRRRCGGGRRSGNLWMFAGGFEGLCGGLSLCRAVRILLMLLFGVHGRVVGSRLL